VGILKFLNGRRAICLALCASAAVFVVAVGAVISGVESQVAATRAAQHRVLVADVTPHRAPGMLRLAVSGPMLPPATPAVAVPVLVRGSVAKPQRAMTADDSGGASWYHAPDGTCAHDTAPIGTVITVTRVSTGDSTTCRVADRGPNTDGRVIDLSMDVYSQLAAPDTGVIDVKVQW
jgi:rare lipoprotein A